VRRRAAQVIAPEQTRNVRTSCWRVDRLGGATHPREAPARTLSCRRACACAAQDEPLHSGALAHTNVSQCKCERGGHQLYAAHQPARSSARGVRGRRAPRGRACQARACRRWHAPLCPARQAALWHAGEQKRAVLQPEHSCVGRPASDAPDRLPHLRAHAALSIQGVDVHASGRCGRQEQVRTPTTSSPRGAARAWPGAGRPGWPATGPPPRGPARPRPLSARWRPPWRPAGAVKQCCLALTALARPAAGRPAAAPAQRQQDSACLQRSARVLRGARAPPPASAPQRRAARRPCSAARGPPRARARAPRARPQSAAPAARPRPARRRARAPRPARGMRRPAWRPRPPARP
jgi:hypothetical protein